MTLIHDKRVVKFNEKKENTRKEFEAKNGCNRVFTHVVRAGIINELGFSNLLE